MADKKAADKAHERLVDRFTADLREKIARWHRALQVRHVDREWPALTTVIDEMATVVGCEAMTSRTRTPARAAERTRLTA